MVDTGQNTFTFLEHTDHIKCVCLSKDGKLILSGSDDGTIKLWSYERKELITSAYASSSVESVVIS